MKDKNINAENDSIEFYPETKRPLIRPKIDFGKTIIAVLLVLAIDCIVSYGITCLLSRVAWYDGTKDNFGWVFVFILTIVCLASILICSKKIVIFVIRLYQRYAPYDIRSSCLFVPNCSEYMVLAIEKYGLVKGLKKGIDRYHRCHAPNGGEDYP